VSAAANIQVCTTRCTCLTPTEVQMYTFLFNDIFLNGVLNRKLQANLITAICKKAASISGQSFINNFSAFPRHFPKLPDVSVLVTSFPTGSMKQNQIILAEFFAIFRRLSTQVPQQYTTSGTSTFFRPISALRSFTITDKAVSLSIHYPYLNCIHH